MGILDRFTASPRDRFAIEALKLARRMPGVASARYDREQFAIAVTGTNDPGPVWVYLSNVYGECEGTSRNGRRERIERLLRIILKPPADETWESVRPKLRPVLRPVMFGRAGVTGMAPPISRPAMPYLRELVVVDQPESMVYVTPPRLDDWGVTADEVVEAARANLEPMARDSLEAPWPTGNALIRMVDSGDGYFTSLPLVPGWLAGVSERMGAPAVAFLPDTNTVVLCAVAGAGLSTVYGMIEKEYGGAVRSLSPVGYVADDRGHAVPYAPPPDHPDHFAARRAEVVLAATEYDAQTRWLTKEYEQAGIEVSVAPLLAVARPGSPATTVAAWTDGVTSLLPEAQFISFARDEVPGPRIPWRAVATLLDLRPEPLLAPLRYRVEGWPPPDVMDRLFAHAVE
jgi:hypothetical protein